MADFPRSFPLRSRVLVPMVVAVLLVITTGASAATTWVIVPSPNPADTWNSLRDVVAVSPSDVWAVGDYWQPGTYRTLVEHWDGTSWAVIDSPNRGDCINGLSGVAASSSTDVWAVGWSIPCPSGTSRTLIEHWDGASWELVPSPNVGTGNNTLEAVTAASSTDAWAIGLRSKGSGARTLIEHWDGKDWRVVPNPKVDGGRIRLSGVVATSNRNAWAVGWVYDPDAADPASTKVGLIEHWNGKTWSRQGSPTPGDSSELVNVVGRSSSGAWAVGSYLVGSDRTTLIEHFDGSGWSRVASPNAGDLGDYLYDVVVSRYGNAWAVGGYGVQPVEDKDLHTLIERWNGSTWKIVPSLNVGSGDNRLTGASAIAGSNVWAVGTSKAIDFSASTTLIERRDD